MSNLTELKSALKEILNENGTLNKIRAEIRESIFKAIESNDNPKPKIPEENLIINELIREYFNYMGYHHSSSVFLSESGHPEDPPVDRNFIAKELNIIEEKNSRNIPLLYSVLFGLKKESYQPIYDNTSVSVPVQSIQGPFNYEGKNNFQNTPIQNSLYNSIPLNLNNQNTMNNLNSNNLNNQNYNSKDQPKAIVFNN